ncbi:unnamed protein product, partial [Polarella glacialis]
VENSFTTPGVNDLQEELRQLSPEEIRRSPEKVVLQPVRLVLKWFEKIEPSQSSKTARSPLARLDGEGGPMDRLSDVCEHLQKSPFYRCLLLGMLASIVIFVYHWHLAGIVFTLMHNGGCRGPTIVACGGELVRTVCVMVGMVCYFISLGVVLWNVERLDAVLQVQGVLLSCFGLVETSPFC